ncbi:prepilin-type N-terminal cleavage/methylation domain-containing protein [Moritella sp. Urea-trap-13]|uniref:prepilin-type N-terminal cleavage/methylation domain-containing protein n=1 Tax=Moritella sp. Urea-trap-13 TaxID=2058327 RepID=UPI000C32354C|nr:prepilin-type N-terminal cleavage/methylation domain-containing protein [Moritella sp. Urea-trap-13]PKH07930.1 prepilin-type cleavage/methylation domain-containing protein [Moritella sp. Urea-trap-13]
MASRTKGFTLIELAIVIVILAIISAVAVPKFINLSGDAKKSKIASVAAELRIAIDLIYYKALILGLEGKCYDTKADNENSSDKDQSAQVEGYLTCNGYPIAYQDSIKRLLSLDDEYKVTNTSRAYGSELHRVLAIVIGDNYTYDKKAGDYCQLIYQPNSIEKIVVLDSGC